MPKAPRFAFTALLLGCTALSGSAHAGWFDFGSKPDTPVKAAKPAVPAPAANLEDSIRQAQMLRLAGSYPEAISHLSQLMMVASDDPRVISEYGKTLAAMGRAQDAVNFLTRAQQLQPGDWTVYSAMGVAYDQLGNQKDAQIAYENALTIKPGEPSVLNNYALSRMLAKDPDMARKLAGRAEIAGGASDPKIARNITMIRSMAPEAPEASTAVKTPATSPVSNTAVAAQQPAPRIPVTVSAMPQPLHTAPAAAPAQIASTAPKPATSTALNTAPAIAQAASAPKPVAPVTNNPTPVAAQTASFKPVAPLAGSAAPAPNAGNTVINAQAQAPRDNRVVMQRVPVDPLAGHVYPAGKTDETASDASHAPRPLQPQTAASKPTTAKTGADATSTVRAEAPKPAPAPVSGVKSPAAQAQGLQAKADAIAKQLTNKPAAIAAAKTEANKDVAAKTETNKNVAAKTETNKDVLAKTEAGKPAVPAVKTAETKPAAASKLLDPKALEPAVKKTADAKPAPQPKVLDSKPATPVVKAAEAKPAPASKVLEPKAADSVVKTAEAKAATVKAAMPAAKDAPKAVAAKSKDSIPGLRMSANAY